MGIFGHSLEVMFSVSASSLLHFEANADHNRPDPTSLEYTDFRGEPEDCNPTIHIHRLC